MLTVGAGVAFGLAILTKELVALALLALLAFAVCARRTQLGAALRVAAVATLVYAVYPLWAVAVGQGERYLLFKLGGVLRFLNLFRDRPELMPDPNLAPISGPPLIETISVTLDQYIASYILIAAGAVLIAVLFLRQRQRVEAAYLLSWAAVTYGYIGFGIVFGRISDQFF